MRGRRDGVGQLTAVNTVSTKQCRWCSVLILVLFDVLNFYRFEIQKDLKSVTKAYMYGVLCQKKLELSRAHIPHVPSICSLLYRDRPVMLMISTKLVVCMSSASGHGRWAWPQWATNKMLFVTLVDHTKQFEAYSNQSFTDFDWLVKLTSCPKS